MLGKCCSTYTVPVNVSPPQLWVCSGTYNPWDASKGSRYLYNWKIKSTADLTQEHLRSMLTATWGKQSSTNDSRGPVFQPKIISIWTGGGRWALPASLSKIVFYKPGKNCAELRADCALKKILFKTKCYYIYCTRKTQYSTPCNNFNFSDMS